MLNERSRSITRVARHFNVSAAFKSIRGFARENKSAGGLSYGKRIEVCAFKKHVTRGGRYLTLGSAHYSCDRNCAAPVGNHQDRRVQLTFNAVQGDDLFIQVCAADDDLLALKHVRIERVQGLTKLEHDVIRDVRHVIDGTDTETL